MRIGIDIDDTVAKTYETINKIIKKKYNYDLEKFDRIYFSNDLVKKLLLEENEYIDSLIEPKENAVSVVNSLKDKGWEIYFITARNDKYYDNAYLSSYNWLKKHGFKFDKILTSASNKAEVCIKNNIDIFIDDSINHYKNVTKKGIKSYLFTSYLNKLYTVNDRVDNWSKIEETIDNLWR